MPETATNIMIIAGEVSGDLIGASLIKELKRKDPSLGIFGIGGDKMKAAGMELNYHIKRMAFLGFTEIIRHIPFVNKVQRDLLGIIKEKKITLAVLIDYPGFNLRIARKLKAIGVKVIYYVSPQVWAWGAKRVIKIRKYTQKMLVLFQFEEQFYIDEKVDVKFVGHPILERIKDYNFISKEELFEKFQLNKSKELLLLMPGSRENEIEKLFPLMMRSAEKICSEHNLQPVVACSSNINDGIFRTLFPGNYKVVNEHNYDLMKYSRAGIIKSGTSTLEAALFELPFVIVYRTSGLTYLIGKNLIKLKNIGLVNIVAGEKIVPELIQNDVTEDNIFNEVNSIISNQDNYQLIKKKLRNVKARLGETGASEKAASIIYNEIKKV
jgi:lipid-A-disaccharide synthase